MASQIGTVVERLQTSRREVLRSDQLAAVGKLAAGMAHELRNPLMTMKILVQSAIERGESGSLAGRDLNVLDEEIKRQERSLQNFLDFARPQKLQTRIFDILKVVKHTLTFVAGQAERQSVHIHCDLPVAPISISGDAEQIRQVFLNLLLNAFDALPEGGEVFVTISQVLEEMETTDGMAAASVAARPPNWLVVCVADNGRGVPLELGDQIFEPFVSTKDTGTGLGLSICHQIVTAHGGQISAVNRPTGGAEFIVQLPLAMASGGLAAAQVVQLIR
jgi:signal transduction histidine kinase